MKTYSFVSKTTKKILALFPLCALLLLAVTTPGVSAEYRYTTIPTSPWYDLVYPAAMNDNNVVVGTVANRLWPYLPIPYPTIFLYWNGIYTELWKPGLMPNSSSTLRINNRGAVTGFCEKRFPFYSQMPRPYTFLYRAWIFTEVPAPPGYEYFIPQIFTDSGTIIGSAYGNTPNKSLFMYSQGSYTEIQPPGLMNVAVSGINNRDQIIGVGNDNRDIQFPEKGFLYSEGTYTELLPPGCWASKATSINDSGTITVSGIVGDIFKPTGFLYQAGVYTELLPPGWKSTIVGGINSSGAVIGRGINRDGIEKGFIYNDGIYTELLPPGWKSAVPGFMNDAGTVVGIGYKTEDDPSARSFFVYNSGIYTELLPPGWKNFSPVQLNNSGAILGSGFDSDGKQKACIAVPE